MADLVDHLRYRCLLMKKTLALSAVLATISTQTFAWDCGGYYSNIKYLRGADDMAGYEVYVNEQDPRKVDLILIEGEIIMTNAKQVRVSDNVIKFSAYNQTWTLSCFKRAVTLVGSQVTEQFLRRGSFVVRNRLFPRLVD